MSPSFDRPSSPGGLAGPGAEFSGEPVVRALPRRALVIAIFRHAYPDLGPDELLRRMDKTLPFISAYCRHLEMPLTRLTLRHLLALVDRKKAVVAPQLAAFLREPVDGRPRYRPETQRLYRHYAARKFAPLAIETRSALLGPAQELWDTLMRRLPSLRSPGKDRNPWALWVAHCAEHDADPMNPSDPSLLLAGFRQYLDDWGYTPDTAHLYVAQVRPILRALGLMKPRALSLGRYRRQVDAWAAHVPTFWPRRLRPATREGLRYSLERFARFLIERHGGPEGQESAS